MFTGIVTDIGTVRRMEKPGDTLLEIACHYAMDQVMLGASIACNGICLTVTDKTHDSFTINASAETCSKTTLGDWKEGTSINLERALCVGDELGGHLVSGHVDGVATIAECEAVDDSLRVTIKAPATLMPYIAQKGSVTLDGVSLTVNSMDVASFTVNLIPHTQAVTTLNAWKKHTRVNLEIDMLARYVERILQGTQCA